ncbi:MAG: hypothetical protein R3Y43_04565 [Alphaproteobacteria bacterium]
MANLIKNLKNLFKTKDGAIDNAKAKNIQKSYAASLKKKCQEKEVCTPPHLAIKEQIFDDNIQIAKCAVFNVGQIAINTAKHKKSILQILEKASQDNKLTEEVTDYILEVIEDINKS